MVVRGGNPGDDVSPRLEAPEAGTPTAGGGLRRFPRDNVVTSRGVEAGLCHLVVVTEVHPTGQPGGVTIKNSRRGNNNNGNSDGDKPSDTLSRQALC